MSNEGRRVSYSQYSMWYNCPHQWKLAYVDKIKPKDVSIHLIFGTSVHLAIQSYLEVLYNQESKKAKWFDMEEIFRNSLFELFKKDIVITESGEKVYPCDKSTLMEFYQDGCEILNYARKNVKHLFPTSGYELVGCEVPLTLEVASHVNYVGYIDIVIREKKTGKVIIYDLKTSGKGWYYEKKDPKKINQLLLYKHFYSNLFKVSQEDIDIKFIILKRKLDPNNQWAKRVTEFSPSQGNPSVKKAVNSFNDFLSVFDENGNAILNKLKPTPSEKACKFCPFLQTKFCSHGIKKG